MHQKETHERDCIQLSKQRNESQYGMRVTHREMKEKLATAIAENGIRKRHRRWLASHIDASGARVKSRK
jgi:hypothetical protein